MLAIDQAIAGGSNILVTLLAAQLLDVESFGMYFVIFLTFVLLQGGSRAAINEPLLLHPREASSRAVDVVGSTLLVGICSGLLLLIAGLVILPIDSRLGAGFLALAPCAPLIGLQDAGRYLAIATRRPGKALVLDLVWLLLVVPAAVILIVTDSDHLWQFTAVWGAAGSIAGLLVFWQQPLSGLRLSLVWAREVWPVSWRYLLNFGLGQGSSLGLAMAVLGIAGARAMGAIQGALLLQRPFVVFQVASMSSGIVDVGHVRDDPRAVWRVAVRITTWTATFALVNGLVIIFLPDRLGELLLGDTWSETRRYLLPAAAQILAMSLMSGARSGLLGRHAIRRATYNGFSITAMSLILIVIGLAFWGTSGGMWALVVGHVIGAVVWWSGLAIQLRRPPIHPVSAPDQATETAVGDSGVTQ